MAAPASWKRTHTCGALRREHVGQEVVLNGWIHARRNHGGIYFLDLRDRYGLTQVVVSEQLAATVKLTTECVLSVRGKVHAREAGQVNTERDTGAIELVAQSVEVLSSSPTTPFEIAGGSEAAIETRLRWRYLDLRRMNLQRNLVFRSRFIQAMRRAFERADFVEVETPILTKATPEGARDYLVPSRVHPGEFYALPQSPQIFKQILMVAGFDRYFQVARCFRDEDLRADRQPEFTQLDMEMSFVEEDDVFAAWERVLGEVFAEVLGETLTRPFPRMRWSEAMDRYGSDKPDLRIPLELKDARAFAEGCGFGVFQSALASGGNVSVLVVPAARELSRKDLTQLEEVAKAEGAKGLAWWKASAAGGSGPLARFCADGKAPGLMQSISASEGDTCLFVADRYLVTKKSLGAVRLAVGRSWVQQAQEGTGSKPARKFLWVTHFPMFQHDSQTGTWASEHHPFTAPEDWTMGGDKPDLAAMASRAYDLVYNGWELGSGSVRIHRADVQQRVFQILGLSPEEQQQKFGFLLEALSFGAPPHAGFALGLDRCVALALGLDNIRDVVAFPKTASATDLMCGAPSIVSPSQLEEVHVRTVLPPS